MKSINENIKRLPIDPGPSGWNELLPPPHPPKILEKNILADWVIVGAGWAGLAAARRLTKLVNGEKIVLLEASRIGEGPAGRNSGFMIDVPHNLSTEKYEGDLENDKKTIVQNKAAINFSKEAFEEYKMHKDAFSLTQRKRSYTSDYGYGNVREVMLGEQQASCMPWNICVY